MPHVSGFGVTAAVIAFLFASVPALAQDDPAAVAVPAPVQAPAAQDRDFFASVEQPDFTVITLPTTLRLPRFRSAFRVTHRFGRPLGAGTFGDLAGDLFGLDSGAQIGLEYRFGLVSGTQVGIHRTSNKTIQLFGQQSVLRQSDRMPSALAAHVGIEGMNNFREHYSAQLGAVVSRTFTNLGAIYVEPMWIDNTNPLDAALTDENDSLIVGLGARIRIGSTVYLLAEVAPRVGGYDPGVSHGSFAVEKRAGGHSFQINVSNGFGTTLGQVARGGLTNDDWYLGFNISRKFF
jgi:hypothetical protein